MLTRLWQPSMSASSPPPPCEGFSVEELLNLWDFEETETETVENKELMEPETEAVAGNQQPGPFFSSSFSSSSVERSRPLSGINLIPAHDEEELEWLSFIIDDSLPGEVAPLPSLPKVQNGSDDPQRESSQRPHGAAVAIAHGASLFFSTVPPKAKRSKRPRAPTVGASSCLSAPSSSCLLYGQPSFTGDQSYLLNESHTSLPPPPPPPPPSKKTKGPKKRGRKPKQQPASVGSSGSLASSGERRCSHCGAQKTPQWRAGPLGAKTLCNACGVRYKSGRLLPEYRPACSPTYVDSIHSSSHRKVLELRRRKEAEFLGAGPRPVAAC